VPQAGQSHSFTALGSRLLRDRADDVYQALLRAGAQPLRMTDALPPTATGTAATPANDRGDELIALGCRRTVYEQVLASVVLARPGVSIERGTTVRGLVVTGVDGRVAGVRTDDGRVLDAEIVLDATGTASSSRRWLKDAGVPVAADRTEPVRATSYAQFFRLCTPGAPGPLNRGNAAGGLWQHYAGVLHPGDNDTFTISLGTLSDDVALRGLRDEAAFRAAVLATPPLAPWLADGVAEAISPVRVMRFPDNALRGPATTRQHPVPGLYPIGDAACVTDPTFGRGVALALAHAYRLAEVLAAHPRVDVAQSRAVAAATEELFTPWFEQAVLDGAECQALWRTHVHGDPPPARPTSVTFGMAALAATVDAVVWRRLCAVLMTEALPATLYGDPEIGARIFAALPRVTPPPVSVPGRAELVELVHAAAGAGLVN
jgi:2-polyprenyl-6-methoxyphenol hydroxylase-like FAD-dependent oxidoreductase